MDSINNLDLLRKQKANELLQSRNYEDILRSGFEFFLPRQQIESTPELYREILNKCKDSEYAYKYAKEVLMWKSVPPEIMNDITKDPEYTYLYVRDVLKGQKVPPEVMSSIIKDPEYAFKYAKEVLRWKDVPPEVMNSLIRDPLYAFIYARDVLKGQNIPPEVIDSIIKNPDIAYNYAKEVSKWQNVPPKIMSVLQHAGYPISLNRIVSKIHNNWLQKISQNNSFCAKTNLC